MARPGEPGVTIARSQAGRGLTGAGSGPRMPASTSLGYMRGSRAASLSGPVVRATGPPCCSTPTRMRGSRATRVLAGSRGQHCSYGWRRGRPPSAAGVLDDHQPSRSSPRTCCCGARCNRALIGQARRLGAAGIQGKRQADQDGDGQVGRPARGLAGAAEGGDLRTRASESVRGWGDCTTVAPSPVKGPRATPRAGSPCVPPASLITSPPRTPPPGRECPPQFPGRCR